jgi:type IV secretion system protein TrbL
MHWPIRYAVAVGAKLFVLTLIVGLIAAGFRRMVGSHTNDEASLMTLVGLSLVCAYLTKTIPELIGGMISGTSMGGGSAMGAWPQPVQPVRRPQSLLLQQQGSSRPQEH